MAVFHQFALPLSWRTVVLCWMVSTGWVAMAAVGTTTPQVTATPPLPLLPLRLPLLPLLPLVYAVHCTTTPQVTATPTPSTPALPLLPIDYAAPSLCSALYHYPSGNYYPYPYYACSAPATLNPCSTWHHYPCYPCYSSSVYPIATRNLVTHRSL